MSFEQICMVENYEDLCNGLGVIELDRETYDHLTEMARYFNIGPSRLLHEAIKLFIKENSHNENLK